MKRKVEAVEVPEGNICIGCNFLVEIPFQDKAFCAQDQMGLFVGRKKDSSYVGPIKHHICAESCLSS